MAERNRSTYGMTTTCGVRSKQFGKKIWGSSMRVNSLTYRDQLCRGVSTPQGTAVKKLGRFKVAFTATTETELVKHINEVESMLFGFTGTQLRKIAFQFAELNNIEYQVSRKKNEPAGSGFVASCSDTVTNCRYACQRPRPQRGREPSTKYP